MTDTAQLLDGTVDDVKSRLAGLDAAALTDALAAEQAGKNRKGVTDAIELAQTASTANTVTYTSDTDRGDTEATTNSVDVAAPAAALTTAASLDASPAANIAPATEFEPSGAPLQSSGFDLDHAALDPNPRAHTTEAQNRIDFNDPTIEGREAVEKSLAEQAK